MSALKKASSALRCFSDGRSHVGHCDPRWRCSCGGPRLDIIFLASVNHATALDLGAVLEVMVDGSVLPVFLPSSVVHTSNVDAVDENARVSFALDDAAVPGSHLAGDPLHLRVERCERCR